MKVKDLIKKLKEYDEEMETEIQIYGDDYSYVGIGLDEVDFKEKIESFMIGKDGKPIGSRFDNTIEEAMKNTIQWENIKRRKILTLSFKY